MIKLAIFRRGDYRYLEIDEDIWLYKMSENQKKNHFAKVMSITVQDALQKLPVNAGYPSRNNTNVGDCLNKALSISWQEARLRNSSLHAGTLGNIWRKAERLLSNSNFIKEKPSIVSYPKSTTVFCLQITFHLT